MVLLRKGNSESAEGIKLTTFQFSGWEPWETRVVSEVILAGVTLYVPGRSWIHPLNLLCQGKTVTFRVVIYIFMDNDMAVSQMLC